MYNSHEYNLAMAEKSNWTMSGWVISYFCEVIICLQFAGN